jgi:hypothetical protein
LPDASGEVLSCRKSGHFERCWWEDNLVACGAFRKSRVG